MSRAKYLELVIWIKEQIAVGKFKTGDKLYSENALKEMFHVSRETVRHAIGKLEQEGVLVKRQGSGTYIADLHWRELKKRTRILVVTTYVDGYIFPRTIQGIQSVLSENGYTVDMAFTNNRVKREKSVLEDALENNEIAGIIIEPTRSGIPNPNMDLYRELIEKRIPILFVNCYYPSLSIPHVSLNDRRAGERAAEYLLEMGHRKIAGIFKLDDYQGHLRYQGYMDALKRCDLDIEDSRTVWFETANQYNLEECKQTILNRFRGCTAVVCYNDQIAYELLKLLGEEGVRVPDDLSLVSIDNSELTVVGDVELSSVPHPMEKLGEKAAENLLKMIEVPTFDGTYEFDTEIVVRNSVKEL